jgi:hypothetical protein
MLKSTSMTRRHFLNQSLAATGAVGVAAEFGFQPHVALGADQTQKSAPASAGPIPCGTIGKVKLSRMLLGGNLISGGMHCRDLKYVKSLFRAYVTEEKLMETLKVAEAQGINTVFETGATYVERYNREYRGHMQFIPHIEVPLGQAENALKDHIQRQVDTGAVALYVWGVSADSLVKAGAGNQLVRAVELAKAHGLPVGVGSHSLMVTRECERLQAPCDFYVKTFHSDDYPSATPKELRREFMWLGGGKDYKGWYDNMWCINPEETAEFMKAVTKPWIAFKVLAAGAFIPRQGFAYAFDNGADFIAVGMFDFQIAENCEVLRRQVKRSQERSRPWRA